MKVRSLIGPVLFAVVIFEGQTLKAVDITAIDAKVKRASEYFSKPDQDEGAARGLKLITEAIALAAPETGFPVQFGEEISAAAKEIEPGASSFEDGASLLMGSYRLINSGKDFQMSPSISNMEQAKEYIRTQIDKARSYLAQGKIAEFARSLLEVALMIVTPVIR